jgi:hypothetical protein
MTRGCGRVTKPARVLIEVRIASDGVFSVQEVKQPNKKPITLSWKAAGTIRCSVGFSLIWRRSVDILEYGMMPALGYGVALLTRSVILVSLGQSLVRD